MGEHDKISLLPSTPRAENVSWLGYSIALIIAPRLVIVKNLGPNETSAPSPKSNHWRARLLMCVCGRQTTTQGRRAEGGERSSSNTRIPESRSFGEERRKKRQVEPAGRPPALSSTAVSVVIISHHSKISCFLFPATAESIGCTSAQTRGIYSRVLPGA